jgi:hypothetical protein
MIFYNEHPKIKYYMDMPRNHATATHKKPTKITII